MFSKSLGFLFSLLFFLSKAVSIFFLLLCEIAIVSYVRFPLKFCSGNWRAGGGKNDPFVHARGLTGVFPEPKACNNTWWRHDRLWNNKLMYISQNGDCSIARESATEIRQSRVIGDQIEMIWPIINCQTTNIQLAMILSPCLHRTAIC